MSELEDFFSDIAAAEADVDKVETVDTAKVKDKKVQVRPQ